MFSRSEFPQTGMEHYGRKQMDGMAVQGKNALVVPVDRGTADGGFGGAFWAADDGFIVGSG